MEDAVETTAWRRKYSRSREVTQQYRECRKSSSRRKCDWGSKLEPRMQVDNTDTNRSWEDKGDLS